VTRNHALADKGRKIAGAAMTRSALSRGISADRGVRSGRGNCFLHVDEAMPLGSASIDRNQDSQSQPPQELQPFFQ
jgi:hypothetical protein